MKPKKVSADWYIAATHWLTATITSTIFVAIIVIILDLIFPNPLTISIGLIIIYPLMMWVAIKYSVKYLDKTYVIKNANQIVILSTIYLVITGGGFRIYNFLQTGTLKDEYVGFLIVLFVFYFVSKKYIKNNSTPESLKSNI